jgi:hypothetical protein
MDAIEEIKYKGFTIGIHLEEQSESPREWDNIGAMICFHGRYNLGDKHTEYYHDDSLAFQDWLEVTAKDLILLPLYLYDHGGITMNTTGFHCPWDSGQVGYIYTTREDVLKEYDWKRLSRKRVRQIEDYLRNEVKIYDQYLRGEVYGYIVEDKDGEDIDSCWGYYDKDYMVQDAKDGIDYQIKTTQQQLELLPC